MAEGIPNGGNQLHTVDRKSSHPRKRTISSNLGQQTEGRMTESAVAQLIAGAVDEPKHEEQVAPMACHLTLNKVSKGIERLALPCTLGSLTQRRYVVIPFGQGEDQLPGQR